MDSIELLQLIDKGETSDVQFKQEVTDPSKVAAELVAFSNTQGGKLIIGVADNLDIIGLSDAQIETIGQLVANVSTNNIAPPINVISEIVVVDEAKIMVIYVKDGSGKPYKDNKGVIWMKNGSDKRKVLDNNEILRLFQKGGSYYADESVIVNTTINDVNQESFERYYGLLSESTLEADGIPYLTALENTLVIREDKVTLGGLLFFGKNPQQYRPAFCVKAISFIGNDLEGTSYRDSEDINGTLPSIFERSISFITRNLNRVQARQGFNTEGNLEIPKLVLEEIIQNALVHRDYFINDAIKIFIYDNRVEIISPGVLPNSLTIDQIKFGRSVVRNNNVITFANKLMPYRGIGSGIRRSIKALPNIEFDNDLNRQCFVVTIPRSSVEVAVTLEEE